MNKQDVARRLLSPHRFIKRCRTVSWFVRSLRTSPIVHGRQLLPEQDEITGTVLVDQINSADAKARGGKLIVMDPRGVDMRKFADEMLQFRPDADVLMPNVIMNVIVEDVLYDSQYIHRWTENREAEKEHLRQFTPQVMSPVCGIKPDELRRVARTFAQAKASLIYWGMGVSQHIHGTDNSRCPISLALMTGNVGKPGAGLHPLRGQNNIQGASDPDVPARLPVGYG